MEATSRRPEVALPGWYPDGAGRQRWWDGARWTEHTVALPFATPLPPARRRWPLWVGLALLGAAFALVSVAGFALMGDPYPISRVGVERDGDGLVVVNAVCPGERLVELTLRRHAADGTSSIVWQLRGDAPVPESLPFGEAVDGVRTTTALATSLDASASLSLWVATSELTTPYAMEFRPDEVPDAGVLWFGDVAVSRETFSRAALLDTPCGDPYSNRGPTRFAVIVGGAAAGLALVGIALLVLGRPRRGGGGAAGGGQCSMAA